MDMFAGASPAVTLSSLRRRAGLTQAEVAALAGTSQATVSAYESGSKEPSLRTFSRLLAVLGARLAVEPAPTRVHQPSQADLARSGRILEQVISLAEALPARREPKLRFPRLKAAADTP
jgi:transcriptional regulator with XRE-family HTH domain